MPQLNVPLVGVSQRGVGEGHKFELAGGGVKHHTNVLCKCPCHTEPGLRNPSADEFVVLL